MDENKIRLTIHPPSGGSGPLSVSDFLKQVSALKQLVLLASIHDEIDAHITRLSMNSPASIELEAWAAGGKAVVPLDHFFAQVGRITQGEAPLFLGRPVFDALRDFASVVGRGVSRAVLQTATREIVIDLEARRRIEEVFGGDYTAEGTVDGMLEAVNVHSKDNTFALYPVVGPARLTCKFDDSLLDQVKPALGRYVVISGELRYRWREKHPYEARAYKIEALPGWDEQPSFEEIIGMAPGATGGLPSEEFVRNLRDGWG